MYLKLVVLHITLNSPWVSVTNIKSVIEFILPKYLYIKSTRYQPLVLVVEHFRHDKC